MAFDHPEPRARKDRFVILARAHGARVIDGDDDQVCVVCSLSARPRSRLRTRTQFHERRRGRDPMRTNAAAVGFVILSERARAAQCVGTQFTELTTRLPHRTDAFSFLRPACFQPCQAAPSFVIRHRTRLPYIDRVREFTDGPLDLCGVKAPQNAARRAPGRSDPGRA
jgi:hypothetical protein